MSHGMYGLISLMHHIPVLLSAMFWGLSLTIMFPSLRESTGGLLVMLLPLLMSPAWCTWGMIRGVLRRKERHGIACAVMSAAGLVLFGLMIWGCAYLGSRY